MCVARGGGGARITLCMSKDSQILVSVFWPNNSWRAILNPDMPTRKTTLKVLLKVRNVFLKVTFPPWLHPVKI